MGHLSGEEQLTNNTTGPPSPPHTRAHQSETHRAAPRDLCCILSSAHCQGRPASCPSFLGSPGFWGQPVFGVTGVLGSSGFGVTGFWGQKKGLWGGGERGSGGSSWVQLPGKPPWDVPDGRAGVWGCNTTGGVIPNHCPDSCRIPRESMEALPCRAAPQWCWVPWPPGQTQGGLKVLSQRSCPDPEWE